jgi:nucleotide-binding universal stress UspA family protein
MGSVSLALATRSALPVLVVPPGATRPERVEQRLPRALVCGVDDSEHADRAVQAAADLTRAVGLRLVLMHAQGGPASLAMMPTAGVGAQIHSHTRLMERQREAGEETLKRAERPTGGDDLELGTRLGAGDAAELLEQLAIEEDAALIAVGSRGQSAVRAALHGSTSTQLVGLASRPVLIVPPEARLALEPGATDGVA